ncbi:hypothetical protein D9M69_669590 [compost metagenome]
MDQEPGQTPITIHEGVAKYEAERDDPRRYQWIDLARCIVCELHQALHQLATEVRRRRNVRYSSRALQGVRQMVLLGAE